MTALRKPDFIIGGGARCATTWLHHTLDLHPGVHMAQPFVPEPKFFYVDEVFQRGVDYYYRTWFAGVPEGLAAGEKSTAYLESPVVPARMHAVLPEIKLVFILRNPVYRAFSNYLWSVTNGKETEDFTTALALEDERERTLPKALRYARPHAYFSRGLYADFLERYFSLFPRDRILCLKYEDIAENPQGPLRAVHEFLGVEPRPEDGERLGVVNRADHSETAVIPEPARLRLEAAYEEPNRRLAELLGDNFRW